MVSNASRISAIPTNIITGFLGVGKTSSILHLLKTKPFKERWAVLVNEFGEIGIDGTLLQELHPEQERVFIREVPGGCMCCAAGLPMQVALNQLLSQANPDRLLIEPTGLGHPKEVLQILSTEHYQEVLSLQKILTLVDARKLADSRYTTHQTFNQQIAIADTLIGNKQDLYKPGDKERLEAYAKQNDNPHATVIFTQNGAIALEHLFGNTRSTVQEQKHHHHPTNRPLASEAPIPKCGYIKALNNGEGFCSIGWRFSPDKIFNYEKLFSFLCGINSERMKAVFITENGVFGYNQTEDALTEIELDDCMESRIEIIVPEIDDTWEAQLISCIQGDLNYSV